MIKRTVKNFDQKLKIVEEVLDVQFMDWQRELIRKMLEGYVVQWARGCGRTLMRNAYLLMLAMEEDCECNC